jgi:hypothetical protein
LVVLSVFFIFSACGGSGGGGLSGKWETTTSGILILYEFSGKSYTFKAIFPSGIPEDMLDRFEGKPISGNEVTIEKGTYSISVDKIEFVLDEKFISDEKIKVLPFSRTENTFEMEGMRFTKK